MFLQSDVAVHGYVQLQSYIPAPLSILGHMWWADESEISMISIIVIGLMSSGDAQMIFSAVGLGAAVSCLELECRVEG